MRAQESGEVKRKGRARLLPLPPSLIPLTAKKGGDASKISQAKSVVKPLTAKKGAKDITLAHKEKNMASIIHRKRDIKKTEKKATKKTQQTPVTEPEAKATGAKATAVICELDRKVFEDTLKTARDFVDPKSPLFGNVRLVVKDETCNVSVTDLEMTWTRSLPCRSEAPMTCLMPAEIILKEICALEKTINVVSLRFFAGTVSVNERCNIIARNADDFPEIPVVVGPDVIVPNLVNILKRVVPAIATGDYIDFKNKVHLDFKAGRVFATDGHRLHYDVLPVSVIETLSLSREAVKLLVKYEAMDDIVYGEKHVAFALAGGIMTVRIDEIAQLPDLERILVNTHLVKVRFSAAEMLKVIEGAVPLVDDSHFKGVKLKINGNISVESGSKAYGTYKWAIPCETEGKGKGTLILALNAAYLRDAVKAYTTPGANEADNVLLEMKDKDSPFFINGKALIMPMRIEEELY